MYYRRKLFLSLLEKLDSPVIHIDIQKLMFLLTLDQSNPRTYDFIPNRYGCYSFTLHNDQKILEHQGIISLVPDKDNSIYSKIAINKPVLKNLDIGLREDDVQKVSSTIAHYGNQSTMELINITYNKRPFYTIYSEWVNSMRFDEDFLNEREKAIKIIDTAAHDLYTIGYEGLNIETFILQLIRRNIKVLIDVRYNPISMKRDFSKSRLMKYLNEVNISYMHVPDVGIASDIRNKFLPDNKREELFKWYEENILPSNPKTIKHIGNIASDRNVALMCYEKSPKECHRSHLADYCSSNISRISVKHIT